jgi:hypothetical protein
MNWRRMYQRMKYLNKPFTRSEIEPVTDLIRVALDETDPNNWINFKAQNPELFAGNPTDAVQDVPSVSSFRIPIYGTDRKVFDGFDPMKMKYKTTIAGEVLNGILFTEGPDDSVLRYTLSDNIPPNGQHTVHGTVESRNIIHVTDYHTHEPSDT